MSADRPNADTHAATRWPGRLLLLFGLFALASVAAGGWWLWDRFDPFVLSRTDNVAAKVLIDAARQRALSGAEFAQAAGLLGSREGIARLQALAVLQVEAGRSPERRAQARDALEKRRESAGGDFRAALERAIERLGPPK